MPHPPRSQSSFPSQEGVCTRAVPTPNSMFNPNPSSYNAPIRRINSRRTRPTPATIADVFVSSLVMASLCADHSPRARKLSTIPMNAAKDDERGLRGRSLTGSRPQPSKKRLDSFRSSTVYLGVRCVKTQPMRHSGFPQTSEVENNEENRVRGELYVDLPPSRQELQGLNWRGGFNGKSAFEPPRIPDRIKDEFCVGHPLSGREKQRSGWRDELDRQPEHQSPRILNHDVTEATSHPSTTFSIPCAAVISHIRPCTAVIPTGTVFDNRPDFRMDTIRRHTNPISVDRIDASPRGSEGNLTVKEFLTALEDPKKSNQYVFRLYRQLPSPGVALLRKNIRGKLLRRFADPINKRLPDARRYLALVEDMIMAGFPMSRSLWTSAIHLAGRSAGRVTRKDLVRAISVWHNMEHQGKVESDDVVFAVLFDIAIKAGQFTVAERILDQMTTRGISFTRFGHVSKMYYYGMVGDADGIRQTYHDFIKAGHLVDTTVLNCLIASFARVNDMQTASRLYDSMMEAHRTLQEAALVHPQTSQLLPSLTSEMSFYRRKNRDLGRQLKILASVKDQMREQHLAVQQALPKSPDTRTFHILLYHYACRTGNLKRSMSTIADMEGIYTVPPRGMIYLLLFEGFATHGGRRKNWNAEKLRQVWQTYNRALFESMRRYDERFHRRTQKLVWENPLNESVRTAQQVRNHKQPATPSSPTELYIPLPSGKLDANYPIGHDQGESEEGETDDQGGDDDPDDSENIDVDQLFNNPAHNREAEEEMAELDRQIVNGVFLGRRMIVLILRAFGACSDPDEVLEVWLTLERLWYPRKRRAADVQIIKEEVERQISKAQRHMERERYRGPV